jgi:hypothetical protein
MRPNKGLWSAGIMNTQPIALVRTKIRNFMNTHDLAFITLIVFLEMKCLEKAKEMLT